MGEERRSVEVEVRRGCCKQWVNNCLVWNGKCRVAPTVALVTPGDNTQPAVNTTFEQILQLLPGHLSTLKMFYFQRRCIGGFAKPMLILFSHRGFIQKNACIKRHIMLIYRFIILFWLISWIGLHALVLKKYTSFPVLSSGAASIPLFF